MSHGVILGTGRPPGGGHLVAVDSDVTGELRWTPPHDLPPAKERRRIERAEAKIAEVVAMLTAPVETPEE